MNRTHVRSALVALLVAVLFAAPSLLGGPQVLESSPASRALRALVDETWEHQLRASPLFATYTGDHRFDDRLGEVSPEALRRRNEVERGFLKRAGAIDRGALSNAERLDLEILERGLRDSIGEWDHEAHLTPMTNREGFHITVAPLADEMPLRTVPEYENYLKRLRDLPRYFGENIALLRESIRRGRTLPQVVLKGFEETIRRHVVDDPIKSIFFPPFEKLPASIPTTDRERLTIAGREAVLKAAVPAYRSFLEFFEREYLPACRETIAARDLPGGRAFYEHRVRLFTSLDATPEEVHAVGLKEVARIRGAMEDVVRSVKFEGSFAQFLDHLRSDPRFKPRTGDELLKEAALILKRMDGELPRLFKKLPRTPYGLKPVPDYIAPKTTAAYYSQPAGDGSRAGMYFLNLHNLESRPLYVLEALSLHEAVPGHHLQIALAQEIEGLAPFRRFTEFTAFVEGWALYAERLGLEVGFYKDPYQNFGRLTYEMWRACRLVVDTGIHVLGWSRRQAIDYLSQNTALSLHECTTEVDRYIAWPGQALGYKMGELAIRRLREKAEATLGARFDVREFHDILLRNGAIPLGALEREVESWLEEAKRRG